MKKIYLYKGAKEQLESGDLKVWTKTIPYRQNPTRNFPYELDLSRLGEKNPEEFLLEGGILHPARTNPKSLLELLVKANVK